MEAGKTKLSDQIIKLDLVDAMIQGADPKVSDSQSDHKDIDKEAEAILTEARQKALKNQNKIVDDAKEEASRIIKRAREEAELEKKHAMDDMKQEMIQIASLMAQKAVAASITTDIQDTLVEETLKEMGESTWLS